MISSFFASPRWRTWGLWLLPVLLLLLASVRPLSIPDEGRYAEVGRWMLMSGDWLTPRVDGIPFFHKPPLLYWLEAASMAVFGATPWAARIVGLLLIERSTLMKMLTDLFSTDYGLMSLAVIAFILVMAVYFLRVFLGLMDETGKSTHD